MMLMLGVHVSVRQMQNGTVAAGVSAVAVAVASGACDSVRRRSGSVWIDRCCCCSRRCCGLFRTACELQRGWDRRRRYGSVIFCEHKEGIVYPLCCEVASVAGVASADELLTEVLLFHYRQQLSDHVRHLRRHAHVPCKILARHAYE